MWSRSRDESARAGRGCRRGDAAPDPSARAESTDPPAPMGADQRVRRVVVVAASAAAALMVAVVLLIALLGPRNGGAQNSSAQNGSAQNGSGEAGGAAAAPRLSPAPVLLSAGEVQGVHDALHDIDARCVPGRAGASGLERDAEVILDFARRYPDARFPIDDETGRTLSLLMTAREGLRGCSPATAARIDAAVPPQYRLRPTQYLLRPITPP